MVFKPKIVSPYQFTGTKKTTSPPAPSSSSLPKGGIYVPSKTGAGGTYFQGGQGYSVPSNPNVSTVFSPKPSGGGGSSGGGGGSSPAPAPTGTVILTPQGGQSVQVNALLEAQNRAKQEATRKAQERARIKEQLRGQSIIPPFRPKPPQQDNRIYAVYDPRYQGVITSDGKFYPSDNPNWRPKGTVQGQGYSFKEGVGVGPIPETRRYSPSSKAEPTKETGKVQNLIDKLTERIQSNRVTVNELKEYYSLGKNRNKSPQEQKRFRELFNKIDPGKSIRGRVADTIILTLINTGVGVKDLAFALRRDPINTIKSLPSSFLEGVKSDFRLLRTDPLVGVTKIGTEIVLFKGIGKAGKIAKGKLGNFITRNFDPKYVGMLTPGKIIKIPLGRGKFADVQVVTRIPKETMARQVEKAGKKLPLAISSQSDSLLNLIRREKVIRKPIPGEEKFSPLTKKLLNKFDRGVISKNEMIKLNSLIRKQGAKGLLERSFFVDPTGKIRPSRLGVLSEEEGGILDYFRRGVTFRRPKPQILLFDNVRIEAFPPYLRRTALKLRRGISLNSREANALLKFQLQKSGKFKPVGFVTGESELTLAPGEIIKRSRVVGRTIIKGKRVPIIKAEVIKPTGRLKDLLQKLDQGRVSKREGYELADLLRRRTGLKYTYSSLKRDTKKYFSLKRAGISSIVYASKKGKGSKIISPIIKYIGSPSRSVGGRYGKPVPISPTRYTRYGTGKSYPPYYPKKTPPKYPAYYPPIGPPKFPPKYPPIPPKGPPKIIRGREGSKGKRFKRRGNYFDVFAKPIKNRFGKRANRFIKVNTTPLDKSQAEDLRNYITDTSLSRTAFYTPSRNKPGKIDLRFPRGYAKKTNFKFRGYRIVKGKRIKMKNNRVIEFSRNALDTVPEKKKIDLLRRIRQIRIPSKGRKTINRQRRLVKGSREAKLFMTKLRRMKRR